MEVIIGKNAGFCAGVDYTIKKANELLSQGEIYCLGEIVHNRQVIKKLEENGMKTVETIEEIPDGSRVIFRAHGEAPTIYKKAKDKKEEDFIKSQYEKLKMRKRIHLLLLLA